MYYPTKKDFIRLAKKGNLIPVYRELLADTETPVSAFLRMDKGDYSFLLESVEGKEKIARYSFLGGTPALIFKSKGNEVQVITPRSKKRFISQSPLADLKKILSDFRAIPLEGLPRFCGGFVGYIGYDMVGFFENISPHRKDDLKTPDCMFMLADTIVIFDHINHKIKVVANAHIKEKVSKDRAYSEALRKIDAIIGKLNRKLKIAKKKDTENKAQNKNIKISSNLSKAKFKENVLRAKKYIKDGEIIQVVLSQRFKTKVVGNDFDIYRALRSLNPSPYMYYLKFKGLSIVGASPEVFVRCEDGRVELRPIAGTRRRGKDAAEDSLLEKELLASEKERAEHIMLVDLGRNDLGRVCEYGSVKVEELMSVERYSHVMHIVSDITGRLKKGRDAFDLIEAAFPAGTVSGAPKIRAMKIISEMEDNARGPYAGCIVYFGFSGNLDSCITIRTILIKDKEAYIQAGAGIVSDSIPEAEYDETVNKAKAMFKAVELAGRGMR
ncbi:MAG: anthranilate synthase component I [Candidatus Omnitrophica bacterium]|nr:anthranilate synthase component I [Candidatus Omnitrophota bacterium]